MNKRQRKKLAKKRVMDYFMREFPSLKKHIVTLKFSKKRKEES